MVGVFNFEILSKAKEEFVIYGIGSVQQIDNENQVVSMKAIKEAMPQLLKRARFSLAHHDFLPGEIVESWMNKEGKVFKTEVRVPTDEDYVMFKGLKESIEQAKDDRVLFIVGKVFDDNDTALNLRKAIENGFKSSFSISGTVKASAEVCDDVTCWLEIQKIGLEAVTICDKGMNQGATDSVIILNKEDEINEVKKMTDKEVKDETPLVKTEESKENLKTEGLLREILEKLKGNESRLEALESKEEAATIPLVEEKEEEPVEEKPKEEDELEKSALLKAIESMNETIGGIPDMIQKNLEAKAIPAGRPGLHDINKAERLGQNPDSPMLVSKDWVQKMATMRDGDAGWAEFSTKIFPDGDNLDGTVAVPGGA